MIEKTNITIKNKDTNKIIYDLDLDRGIWSKSEYDSRANEIDYVISCTQKCTYNLI